MPFYIFLFADTWKNERPGDTESSSSKYWMFDNDWFNMTSQQFKLQNNSDYSNCLLFKFYSDYDMIIA